MRMRQTSSSLCMYFYWNYYHTPRVNVHTNTTVSIVLLFIRQQNRYPDASNADCEALVHRTNHKLKKLRKYGATFLNAKGSAKLECIQALLQQPMTCSQRYLNILDWEDWTATQVLKTCHACFMCLMYTEYYPNKQKLYCRRGFLPHCTFLVGTFGRSMCWYNRKKNYYFLLRPSNLETTLKTFCD